MSLASFILDECRKMIYDALDRVGIAPSGQWTLPATSLPPEGDTGDGFTPAPHDHGGALYDARKFYGRNISSAAPAEGQGFKWDASLSMYVLGAVGGGGGPVVPEPYVYIVDSDGEYLVDADGQAIYENEVI